MADNKPNLTQKTLNIGPNKSLGGKQNLFSNLRPKRNLRRKIVIAFSIFLALIAMTLAGFYFGYDEIRSWQGSHSAEAQDIKQEVTENPEAGIEAFDEEKMGKIVNLMEQYPESIVILELDSQFERGLVTQRQYDELVQLLKDIKSGNTPEEFQEDNPQN